jgi:ferredoxin
MISRTRPAPSRGFDILRWPVLGRFLRWRHARSALGVPLLLLAALILLDGFTGPQLAPKNLATVLIWVHYRGFLVLALLVAGNLFCMACPFMLTRNLARRFFRPARMWPRRLRNKWAAVVLFALLLFSYELFDLWATPWWTAWLILAYFLAALLIDSLFQRAPFCKYVCPLGQFNFAASLSSPLEIKVRDPAVCLTCAGKACISGRASSAAPGEGGGSQPALRGCELNLYQPLKVGNMDCTFCLDCVHACPYDNVGLLAHRPAAELVADPARSGVGRFSQRPDLAALVLLFTFGALLNAFGMVSPVYEVETWLAGLLGVRSEALILGIIFLAGLVAVPGMLVGLAAGLTRRWARLEAPLSRVAARYAYALAPFGLGMWLAHYAFHFLTGFWTFIPVVQGALMDLGWPVLGAPRWQLGPLVPATWLDPLELLLLGAGWLVSLGVAYSVSMEEAPQRSWRAFLPWAVLLLLLFLAANWLMAQPMEMRGTALG